MTKKNQNQAAMMVGAALLAAVVLPKLASANTGSGSGSNAGTSGGTYTPPAPTVSNAGRGSGANAGRTGGGGRGAANAAREQRLAAEAAARAAEAQRDAAIAQAVGSTLGGMFDAAGDLVGNLDLTGQS